LLHVALLQPTNKPGFPVNQVGTKQVFTWEKLAITELEALMVHVTFGPPKSNGTVETNDVNSAWTFLLGQHVNLASFAAARKACPSGIAPSLHYKSLATLYHTFVKKFDLGSVQEGESPNAYLNKVASDMVAHAGGTEPSPKVSFEKRGLATGSKSLDEEVFARRNVQIYYQDLPQENYLSERPKAEHEQGKAWRDTLLTGDFAGDLAPGGIRMDTSDSFPGVGGNLMGPNHPIFSSGNPLGGGRHGMQPRFDPFGPPGGPMDPSGDRPRQRFPGEPNPDHLPPPNSFGAGNMFM